MKEELQKLKSLLKRKDDEFEYSQNENQRKIENLS